jgi:hypothetical protein
MNEDLQKLIDDVYVQYRESVLAKLRGKKGVRR